MDVVILTIHPRRFFRDDWLEKVPPRAQPISASIIVRKNFAGGGASQPAPPALKQPTVKRRKGRGRLAGAAPPLMNDPR